MAKEYIKFEGGSFLKTAVAKHGDADAFVAAAEPHLFEGDPERDNKLRALYARVTKTTDVEEAPVAEAKGKKGKK